MSFLKDLFSSSAKRGSSGNGVIIITGAAGFIGSCMVQYLNEQGFENLILSDDFGVEEKRVNWEEKKFLQIVERQSLFNWLEKEEPTVDFFIHLGARTDTTEFDYSIHQELNVDYSKDVWEYCSENKVPLIYASSAATYGLGEAGYDDNEDEIESLKPLNPYGISKNEFDKWALQQKKQPPFWAGLKFFNVYGPNEYHKGRMASVIFHSLEQIRKTGVVKLFKSHKPEFKDGEQLRDFIYVRDVVKVIYWMIKTLETRSLPEPAQLELEESRLQDERVILKDGGGVINNLHDEHLTSGIYNLGTGKARSFEDLVKATFAALDKEAHIEFIDMPEDIRDRYQYFTEAKMDKLKRAGYDESFYTLEEGITDYVRNFLAPGKIY